MAAEIDDAKHKLVNMKASDKQRKDLLQKLRIKHEQLLTQQKESAAENEHLQSSNSSPSSVGFIAFFVG